jgi:anthranilate phosphoribosyltransferase
VSPVTRVTSGTRERVGAVLGAATRHVLAGRDLAPEAAREALTVLLDEHAEETDVARFLTALATKGASAIEVAETVRRVLAAMPAGPWPDGASDVVGTGGDGSGSVNISTLAGLVAAAAGAMVAKAGNRSATSRCGSADLLEALGIAIEPGPKGIAALLRRHRFAFVFTPAVHPRVGRLAPLRRRLGFPTLFNLAGPLANPVVTEGRVVGAADARDQEVLAEAAALLGYRRTWVVRSAGGLDELGTETTNRVLAVDDGVVTSFLVDPAELGLRPASREDLRGGDAVTNAAIARALVAGDASLALADVCVLNAAAVLHVSGLAPDLATGLAAARSALADGRARRLLDALRHETLPAPSLEGATRAPG